MREKITVAVTDEWPSAHKPNRDIGKKFLITEMPAAQSEWWAFRAFGAMAHGGAHISPTISAMGMYGLHFMGMQAFVAAPLDETRPLYDEMLTCVQRIEERATRDLIMTGDGPDIEEPETLALLRDEVLKLHANFSMRAKVSMALANLGATLGRIDTSDGQMSPPDLQ